MLAPAFLETRGTTREFFGEHHARRDDLDALVGRGRIDDDLVRVRVARDGGASGSGSQLALPRAS
jgi:hypothetical protein